MAVLPWVVSALEGSSAPEWQQETALALAAALDESPNASLAKELRALMVDLVDAPAAAKGDVSDDLAAKRAARRAAG